MKQVPANYLKHVKNGTRQFLGEDGQGEEEADAESSGGLESETYVLEQDEVITELTAHFSRAKLAAVPDRAKQRDAFAEVRNDNYF